MITHADVRELPRRYLQLAEERPDADAVIYARPPFDGIRLSWSDVANRSDGLQARFARTGVVAGSRCAVTLADHPDTIPTLIALWRLDATVVLIDAMWGERLRRNVIEHSGADFALPAVEAGEVVRIGASGKYPHALPEDTAMLGYTSGSTGDPKGIPFTHHKLALTMYASAAAGAALRGTQATRLACSARLSGSGTLNMHYTWAAFADAAVVVLPELNMGTAKEYWSRIDRNGIEQTYLVPALVDIVNRLAGPRKPDGAAPLCLSGSAPVSANAQQRFYDRFGLPLVNCYGISEAMCAIFFGCVHSGVATNDVGVPWLLQGRLIDRNGQEVRGTGEGELQLAGPTLFDGYYGNPIATDMAFDGRWFKTGDIMRRNASGVYSIAGRIKDVVMKGGFAVYLNEVEEAALTVDDVVEAAATPLQTGSGEDIGLIVRIAPDSATTAAIVAQQVRDDLGIQRAPRRVIAVEEALPRTGQDKLDRRAVAALWVSQTEVSAAVPGGR